MHFANGSFADFTVCPADPTEQRLAVNWIEGERVRNLPNQPTCRVAHEIISHAREPVAVADLQGLVARFAGNFALVQFLEQASPAGPEIARAVPSHKR